MTPLPSSSAMLDAAGFAVEVQGDALGLESEAQHCCATASETDASSASKDWDTSVARCELAVEELNAALTTARERGQWAAPPPSQPLWLTPPPSQL